MSIHLSISLHMSQLYWFGYLHTYLAQHSQGSIQLAQRPRFQCRPRGFAIRRLRLGRPVL